MLFFDIEKYLYRISSSYHERVFSETGANPLWLTLRVYALGKKMSMTRQKITNGFDVTGTKTPNCKFKVELQYLISKSIILVGDTLSVFQW